MSSLDDQLIRHNLAMPKADSPLFMAALEFFRKGGGRARAHEIIDRAYARLNPNDDARTSGTLRESASLALSSASSPQANGSDLSASAQSRRGYLVPPVRPNLYGTASLAAKNTLAQSVFDRARTADGRAWGDVGAHELNGMERDGALAKAIKSKLGVLSNQQRFMTIRELMRPESFEQARNDAHGS